MKTIGLIILMCLFLCVGCAKDELTTFDSAELYIRYNIKASWVYSYYSDKTPNEIINGKSSHWFKFVDTEKPWEWTCGDIWVDQKSKLVIKDDTYDGWKEKT